MAITKVTTPVTGFESPVDIGLKIPVGNNFNLPTGVEGMIRNDTDENSGGTDSTTAITFYNGTNWRYFNSTKSPDSIPSENFSTLLYTGNGSDQQFKGLTGDIGFQPDLVWLKQRTGSNSNHLLADTVRGPWKILNPNLNNSTVDRTSVDKTITSLTDGFTVKDTPNGDYECNGQNGGSYSGNGTYVAWCFKAGGAAVANTNGSINSQVSVNNNLGFSIVSYTGVGVSSKTIGHGLDAAPEMIIVKSTSQNDGWFVWHKDLTSIDYYVILNSINYENSTIVNEGLFGRTLPTSTVFSVGYASESNGSGNQLISYCFTSKPGFSKVDYYTGNGGNNPVDVGFEPAFVMIKKSTGSNASWAMFDNKRTTANPSTSALYANESINEEDLQLYFEFTSTGFKNLQSSNTLNASGSKYIYLAFAK